MNYLDLEIEEKYKTLNRSYTYEESEALGLPYKNLIFARALDIIADRRKVPREHAVEYVLYTYGGRLEEALIQALSNLL